MSIELPKPLAAYYAAKNQKDIDGMLACFAADASVRDEGEDRRGHAEIREWMEETTRQYGVTVDPEEISGEADAPVVAALVDGNFPGGPVTLHYHFTLAGGAITHLEIDA
ncbi:ketosteroid isomerase-like protein [Rhizobium sp. BK529]|uniref:nuclear transport factor 2 family protein n=1 Tax=unclassified Rhizobium TaxID=2613769 RepID=UPI00104DC87F|nr:MULTISPECIES: nuclear transport factor 2 family protein [unclassified Rhizobium]MBB3595496.1 ketosteroid isomerase-like protein [Rhizobium sp. BK529]TCS00714.1 ketosteroid isomerase-like protein [Rhizobium sp. BK418]